MCGYRKIDLEQWARKEHYLYYTNSLNVEVNMTANMDVSELLSFCHTNKNRTLQTETRFSPPHSTFIRLN